MFDSLIFSSDIEAKFWQGFYHYNFCIDEILPIGVCWLDMGSRVIYMNQIAKIAIKQISQGFSEHELGIIDSNNFPMQLVAIIESSKRCESSYTIKMSCYDVVANDIKDWQISCRSLINGSNDVLGVYVTIDRINTKKQVHSNLDIDGYSIESFDLVKQIKQKIAIYEQYKNVLTNKINNS